MAAYDELLDKIEEYVTKEEYTKAYFPARDAVYRNRLNLRANYYMALSSFHINEMKEAHRYFHLLQEMQHIYKEEIVSDEIIDSYLEKIPEEDRTQWTDFPITGCFFSSTSLSKDFYGEHKFINIAPNDVYFARYEDWFHEHICPSKESIPVSQKLEIWPVAAKSYEFKMNGNGNNNETIILPVVENSSDFGITFNTVSIKEKIGGAMRRHIHF